jgi:hypothetical protein
VVASSQNDVIEDEFEDDSQLKGGKKKKIPTEVSLNSNKVDMRIVEANNEKRYRNKRLPSSKLIHNHLKHLPSIRRVQIYLQTTHSSTLS